MEEKNIEFDKYVEAFKNLNYDRKKSELINSVKELIAIFDQISKENNIPIDYIHSDEILDLNKENYSESDFLEAIFVYLEVAKDLIGQYLIIKENLH